MPDILATGDWGRDDGILCDDCGGKTYLVDDQGGGLCGYTCENEACGATFQVQYDRDEDYYDDDLDFHFDAEADAYYDEYLSEVEIP